MRRHSSTVKRVSVVVGSPAAHAVTLMRSRLRRSVLLGAGASVLLLGSLQLVRRSFASAELTMTSRAAVSVAVAAAIYAAWRSRVEYVNYLRARAGVRTERRVARVLEQLGAAAVVHGALLTERAGDADHMVLGPCAVVVESKTGRGEVRYRNNALWVGRKRIPRDPLRQVVAQRDLAARRLGVSVDAVVCVVDMSGPPQQHRGAWVCSLDDLGRVIAQLPQRIDADRAVRAARKLHRP
jgi:hypothetical protein